MYKIIGGDQKEYGPISAEEVRRWILEGRLNARSVAWTEGLPEWKPLAAFPEFAEALRLQIGLPPVGTTSSPPANAQALTAQLLAARPHLRIGECLSQSWALLRSNFGLLVGASALLWVVESVCQRVPIINLFYWVIQGVINGGLYVIFLKRIRGQPASIGEVFSGFSFGFAQLLLAGMISTLLTGLGWLLCVVPGIYLAVAWIFTIPLVADKRLEFWSAMELSRKMVTRVWFEVLGLILIAFIPLILAEIGAMIKMSMAVVPGIIDMINSGKVDPNRFTALVTQAGKNALPMWVFLRLVLLLNLPFALGALMYGYESLFGSREPRAA